MLRRTRLAGVLAGLALAGCGGDEAPPPTADAVVQQWGAAINARDWGQACRLSVADDPACERSVRETFGQTQLSFDGPATAQGGDPGDEYFSFSSDRGTVFVTAVRGPRGFAVRLERARAR